VEFKVTQILKLRLQKYWKIISLLALAVFLRVLMIHQRGIWYDDAFSILLAKQPLAQIFSGTAADTMPPLYYILLHYWMKISTQIAWIRMLNLMIFMAMLGYVFAWVKQLSSETAGLLAVFFCSISPFLVYHSQEVRMYMLLAFFQVAYLYYFTRWSSSNVKKFTWLEMVICGAGALYSHNLAIFALLIPGLVLLLQTSLPA
jgi:mannosyltransferase